ncbi:MAG: HEAT repeat domain-containing protein [Candidatus Sulfotelmatobacter sp.]
MTKYYLRILVALALAAVPWAEVAPVPGEQAIRPLFEGADLVCFCSVQSVEALGPKMAPGDDNSRPRPALAVVKVNGLYKSSGPDPVSVTVQCEEGQLWKGERAVLFLKLTAPSVYGLADPFIGSTPFTSTPRALGGSGLSGLESTLADLMRLPGRGDQINAMKLLQGFDDLDARTTARVVPLSSSKDPDIALSALAVLLKSGRPVEVERLREYLAGHPSDAAPISVVSIGTELSKISDERALSDLEALSGSKLLSVRMGSMQALRAMKNRGSASTLVRRMDDSDGYVRYLAVISLAEIFGKYGEYAPNMHLFEQNPGFYVGLWKAWWTQEGQISQTGPAAQ